MTTISTDAFEIELRQAQMARKAWAVTRQALADYQSGAAPAGNLQEILENIDKAYEEYLNACTVLGEKVLGDSPDMLKPELTIMTL